MRCNQVDSRPVVCSPIMEMASPGNRHRLIADIAYEQIRDQIVTLKLAPGMVLREDEMMSSLGIGRTPLRDAVKRLSLEGLVVIQPRQGTTVTEVDLGEIVHVSEVRVDLEGLAAELAAHRLDEASLARCRELLDQLETRQEAGPSYELVLFDEQIHRTIWEAARNPYLIQTLERYFTLSLRVWYFVLESVPSLGSAVHGHARVLEAVIRRDPPAARALMREHVAQFEREVLAAIARTDRHTSENGT